MDLHPVYAYCIEIFDQENTFIISTTSDTNIIESTCQINFETINQQPTISYKPVITLDLSSINTTLNTTADSAVSAIIVAAIAGGISGLFTIFICIVGLIVFKIKKKKKLRKGIFTTHSLNSMFNRYVVNMCLHFSTLVSVKVTNSH